MTCARCARPTDPETVHDHEGDEFHAECCPPCRDGIESVQRHAARSYGIARLAVRMDCTPGVTASVQRSAAARSLLARRMVGAEQ